MHAIPKHGRWTLKKWLAPAVCSALFIGCLDEKTTGPNEDGKIETPEAYIFESRFESGSSVEYSGQVVRNLLIEDLAARIKALAASGASAGVSVDHFMELYDYKDGSDLTSHTAQQLTSGGREVVKAKYTDISTGKNLKGKIAGAKLTGTDKTPDEMMQEWFAVIAENSQVADKRGTAAVYTDADGRDLSQLVNKVLLGSVGYYQATGVYMQNILDQDNSAAQEGKLYTKMEHHWDEAFGYFGAAVAYKSFTDNDLAGKLVDYSKDGNGDGKIDLASEFNYPFARAAGKRDKGGEGIDLTAEVFEGFVEGRTHIVNRGSQADLQAARQKAAQGWEKVIAATVVHYINDTKADMAALPENPVFEDKITLNTHWAEMKGYAWNLQFNPFRLISDSQLEELHEKLGDAPDYSAPGTDGHETAQARLDEAKAIMKSVYGFSDTNLANW